jgi:hypothetical protein
MVTRCFVLDPTRVSIVAVTIAVDVCQKCTYLTCNSPQRISNNSRPKFQTSVCSFRYLNTSLFIIREHSIWCEQAACQVNGKDNISDNVLDGRTGWASVVAIASLCLCKYQLVTQVDRQ